MRILVAEDDPIARRSLEATLTRWGHQVVLCADGLEALAAMNAPNRPQAAILDWMMPGIDGLDIIRRVRAMTQAPYVYILVLTARDRVEDMVVALETGADDFLSKPFNAHELRARLGSGERIVTLQQQLLAAQDVLKMQATHDPLTGLLNCSGLREVMLAETSRAAREGTPLTVGLADLDHFKHINDTYGHQAGDTVLREMARNLTRYVRPYDSVGRYGGEEFLLVFPGLGQAEAWAAADRLCRAIAETPIALETGPLRITISLGIVFSDRPDSLSRPEMLVRAADRALYRAKAGGRNQVVMATEEDQSSPADADYLPAGRLTCGTGVAPSRAAAQVSTDAGGPADTGAAGKIG
jgi:diguanylate cyclase (GGDEF)-like protein